MAGRANNLPTQINLGDHERFSISFVNAKGEELFNLGFSRAEADSNPVVQLCVIGPSGEAQMGVTLFDLKV